MDFLYLILGLAVLILGGEFLVRGAVGFSKKLKISSLVIGMTVVAFGTSAPELLVSLKSALHGNPGIAVGNVIGSNIANIALVLGVTVIIFPIIIDRNTKRIDYPTMLFATLLVSVLALDGWFSMIEGLFMFSLLFFFITWMIGKSRKKGMLEETENKEIEEYKEEPFWKSSMFLALGFVGLYLGADWFVKGAVTIANELLATNPNKDVIIGVTVVAFGTSAPELVASCVAAFKKETDISIGNLIGSNIFNLLAVIGLTSMVKPIEVSESVIHFDLIWMVAITLLLLLVLYIGKRIGRLKGVILFSSYIAYITVIILKIQGVF
tara:strand:+ start:6734 stop:7702 length:969 start_codon:yes stop_codon:yes gene_type:complete